MIIAREGLRGMIGAQVGGDPGSLERGGFASSQCEIGSAELSFGRLVLDAQTSTYNTVSMSGDYSYPYGVVSLRNSNTTYSGNLAVRGDLFHTLELFNSSIFFTGNCTFVSGPGSGGSGSLTPVSKKRQSNYGGSQLRIYLHSTLRCGGCINIGNFTTFTYIFPNGTSQSVPSSSFVYSSSNCVLGQPSVSNVITAGSYVSPTEACELGGAKDCREGGGAVTLPPVNYAGQLCSDGSIVFGTSPCPAPSPTPTPTPVPTPSPTPNMSPTTPSSPVSPVVSTPLPPSSETPTSPPPSSSPSPSALATPSPLSSPPSSPSLSSSPSPAESPTPSPVETPTPSPLVPSSIVASPIDSSSPSLSTALSWLLSLGGALVISSL